MGGAGGGRRMQQYGMKSYPPNPPPSRPMSAEQAWKDKAGLFDREGWPTAPPTFPPTPETPPSPDSPPGPPPTNVAFLALADWGGQEDWPMTTEAQLSCAATMSRVGQQLNTQFVVSAGDNFYETGLQGPATSLSVQSRFKITWGDVYQSFGILSRMPWYVVAGNHDWEGNVTAEIAMSEYLENWVFPSLYYTFTYPIPGSAQTMQFVMIDTETLTGGDEGQVDSAGPHYPQPQINETQWDWLGRTLNTSTADWIIVVGHFPVYSAGENGPTPLLVERLLPMLTQAGVALYISGHDHQLEHIGPSFWPQPTVTDFVVTGAGAKFNMSKDHEDDIPSDTLKFQYGAGCGFVSVHVEHETFTPSALTVTYWDESGTDMYTFQKPNPRISYVPPAPKAPPAPPLFALYNNKSNKIAAGIGACGMAVGVFIIWGGISKAVVAGAGAGAAGAAAGTAARGAAKGPEKTERGERASLLMSQRNSYGGISSAAPVHNRL